MKWNKKGDTFTLTRNELADLVGLWDNLKYFKGYNREYYDPKFQKAHDILIMYLDDEEWCSEHIDGWDEEDGDGSGTEGNG
jgi:hypothetical protein